MKSKLEIIAELKAEYPTLKEGSEEFGYTELTLAQYEETIERWASNLYAEVQLKQSKLQAEADKTALLAKLGITADEAKLLLS